MSDPAMKSASSRHLAGEPSAVEGHLGKLLTLVHRLLPNLDDPDRRAEVQAALGKAAGYLEAARQAHEEAYSRRKVADAPLPSGGVEPEIAAAIAAAVAVLFDRPYRVTSVQPVTTPVPHLNVWALEGRTQIFQSHKIR